MSGVDDVSDVDDVDVALSEGCMSDVDGLMLLSEGCMSDVDGLSMAIDACRFRYDGVHFRNACDQLTVEAKLGHMRQIRASALNAISCCVATSKKGKLETSL
jgi:hypothetical protein